MPTFLGSSIVSFTESIGWANADSSVEVQLVTCEGQVFTAPTVGSPAFFSYEGHEFYGLTDRYGETQDTNGFPMYSVQLTTGMFLLNGMKLILNDYYGASSAIPNLVNVFGYLENNIGFGGSEVNDAGISWAKIANVLTAISNDSTGTVYGGCIKHKSYNYGIDLTNLPAIPDYYRINSDSISLIEFIAEVCEAGGCDFFIRLEKLSTIDEIATGLNGRFKVYTVSRFSEPVPGAIQSYIDSISCISSREIGQEVRKDSTSKFVVGAAVERMWFIEDTGTYDPDDGVSQSEFATFNILPYYGLDSDGNYIIGETNEFELDEYYFDIDIRDINNQLLGDTYKTCEGELRAAKTGREAWERYIAERTCNKYIIDTEPSGTTFAEPFVIPIENSVEHTGIHNPFSAVGEYAGYMPVLKYGYVQAYKASYDGLSNPQGSVVPGVNPFNWWDYYVDSGPKYFYPPYSPGHPLGLPSLSISPHGSFTYISPAVNDYVPSGEVTKTLPHLFYPSSSYPNPYFNRAWKIRTITGWSLLFTRMFESDLIARTTVLPTLPERTYFTRLYESFKASFGADQYIQSLLNKSNTDITDRFRYEEGYYAKKATMLFKKIKDLADNYYGKRYMATIPSTYAAIEPESTKIRLSQVPNDTGYIDESEWDDAYLNGLIPEFSGVNILLSPDDKFYPFIKYVDAVAYSGDQPVGLPYDYQSIGNNDKVFGSPNIVGTGVDAITYSDLWIKCAVWDKVIYQDTSTLLNPRAVVEMPGPVTYDPLGNFGSVQALQAALLKHGNGQAGAFTADTNFQASGLTKILNKFGIDEANLSDGPVPVVPDLFAIPLKSNTLCYGPWYLAGANGPIEYEKNNDLAPWNYGGFSAMDAAGFSRVNDGVTSQTFDETGSVTVGGPPAFNMGDQLITGGPYITDIRVSVGSDGINTQYNFQTWSSQKRLSKLNNYNTEKIKRLNRVSSDLRRAYREGAGNNLWKSPVDFFNDIKGKFINLEEFARRDKGSTSSKIISGESNTNSSSVVIQPGYNAGSQSSADYANKAVMSLDGLFRPYSTWVHDSLPSYTMPEDSGEVGTSLDLNPLKVDNDIVILTGNTEQSGHGSGGGRAGMEVDESGVPNFRGIGFKMPMVGAGWGRDTNGDPVPFYVDDSGDAILDDNGNKQWPPDYMYNSKDWKVGPIYLPWDEARGVWVGGGSTRVYLCKVTNTYNPASFSYEVERSNSRSQFTRQGPENLIPYSSEEENIYDPEFIAYSGNPDNTGSYENLNYTGIDFPHYEAFILRQTTDAVGNDYYNIWTEDCQDCGHVSNPCGFGGHDTSSIGKKILIENPLRQSFDVGDLAFTVDTGRRKSINTGNFVGGSGSGATGHITIDSSGDATFVVDSSGADYAYGGFAIIPSGQICASVSLVFSSGSLSSGTVSPEDGYNPSQTYSVNIYPLNATTETESLPIHWVTQSEFKSQQVITHVECDGGVMQTCSVKVQTQGAKTCEFCGTSDTLLNSF